MTLPNRDGYSVDNTHHEGDVHHTEEPAYWDDVETKKAFVTSHRLFEPLYRFVSQYGQRPLYDDSIMAQLQTQWSLDGFIASRGLDNEELEDEDTKYDEFLRQLESIKGRYDENIENLDRACNEFCNRLFGLLQAQSQLRPITDQEARFKVFGIQQKFDFVKGQLRQNACNEIIALEKRSFGKKKRRALPKEASKVLAHWFFEHLHDPYPSEEEKNHLAAEAGLTITQVNHWFGNKRIRYKKRCLENEQKGGKNFQDESSYESPPQVVETVKPKRVTRSNKKQK
jgi:hypothetical protein